VEDRFPAPGKASDSVSGQFSGAEKPSGSVAEGKTGAENSGERVPDQFPALENPSDSVTDQKTGAEKSGERILPELLFREMSPTA